MTDIAVSSPGPMGWWFNENESVYTTLYRERCAREKLEEVAPERCTFGSNKPVNEWLMKKYLEFQKTFGIDEGFDAYLYLQMILGKVPKWVQQYIGSCVASGGMRAVTMKSIIEVTLLGDPEETLGKSFEGADNINSFAPYNYRAGRKIAGINGFSDGSICGPHIQGFMSYGLLTCDAQGLESDAFPEPRSERAYREWGANDTLLNKFAEQGKVLDLLTSAEIKTGDDWLEANKRFETAMICSQWAFEPDYQHPQWKLPDGTPVWIYKRNRRTSWAHNMTVCGLIKAFGRLWVRILNSWPEQSHKNGFWFIIPLELYVEWLRQASCQTIGDLVLRKPNQPDLIFW